MKTELYPILPELQPYIKVICSMESDASTDTSSFRVLPDTCVELFINFSNNQDSFTTVTGHRVFDPSQSFVISRMSDFMDIQLTNTTRFISICFYPSTAYLFFQLPMSEVVNSLTNLHDLWKTEAKEMEEDIQKVHTNEQKVFAAQQYLIAKLKRNKTDKTINYCLQTIKTANSAFSVAELANKVGVSQRQLSRKFNQCLGLSTKEFMDVNRFIDSLAHLKKHPAMSLTDIAYASGYYDQAHFIHDYKTFTGLTPSALLNARNIILCE
ncbi:AraC family transcriptional regulator [Emticicia soli]|uniref:Helix-turn-helix domain-containing protein n=1 Tax=Emticicia soli TaxID=2027878 RepID=A0ABW5J9T5_9BACT